MAREDNSQDGNQNSTPDASVHMPAGEESTIKNAAKSSRSRRKRGLFGHCRLHLNRLVLVLLVLVTVYLTAGRLLMPLATSQKDWLQARLVETLGLDISVGQLRGSWFRFSPVLQLNDLEIITEQDAVSAHSLQGLNVGLDIPQSLWQRQLIIDRVIVDHLSLLIQEDADGNWSLAGFPAEDSSNIEQLLNLLFNTARLQLTEATLLLEQADGSMINLNNIYLDIQNSPGDHQAQLQLRLNEQSSPIQMAVRLNGNPMGRYTAEAYMDFNNLELAPVLEEALSESLNLSSLDSSGQLWVEFDNQSVKQVQASLNELNVGADFPDGGQALDISTGSVDITAIQPISNEWSIWAENLEFDFFNRPWESGDFFIQMNMQNDAVGLELHGESVDLAILNDMLDVIDLPPAARQVLSDLRPRGSLSNLRLLTDTSGSYPGSFELSANLEEISVDAWNGAPSGTGINGYIQADSNSGFVELDSSDFMLQLPLLFDDSWHYNAINGRVYWTVGNGRVRVHSDVIDARNQNLHGHVQFELNNRQLDEINWDSDLTLLIGVLDFDASYKSLYLPTLENIRGTMDWLDSALISGRVRNSGFLFRGKTSNVRSAMQRTVQTFYQAENASLRYLEGWPLLENADAFISVDNNLVDVSSTVASIGGLEVKSASAQIRPLNNTQGAWLSISAESLASGDAGLDFLRDTPVRNLVGSYLDGWELEGDLDLNVDLGIPLNNPSLSNDIQVAALSNDNSLHIPEFDLHFNGIRGAINYSSSTGLSAPGLSADFLGYPLATRITTGDEGIVISGNGRVSGAALQAWSLQPEFVKNLLTLTNGEFSYQANLAIYDEVQPDNTRSRLTLSSDLLGLNIDLPQPLDKSRDEAAALNLDFAFGETLEQLSLNFRNQLSAQLNIGDTGLQGGTVNFGGRNENFRIRQLNNEPGLLLSGEIGDFDLQEWQEVASAFAGGDDDPTTLLRLIDVNIGNLHAFDLDLQAINLVLQRQDESWKLYLDNNEIQGDFIFPDDRSQPLDVNLAYLRLPREEDEESAAGQAVEGADEADEVDVLADVDPTALPDIDFHTDEFSRGEGNLGAWDFQLRGRPGGATISGLRMLSADAAIMSTSGEEGALLEWDYRNGEHLSSFSGLFSAGDLAQVLPEFGYGAVVQSESARFESALEWPGSPAAFALKKATGQVNLLLENGSFKDIDSGSARLFGAFNFDALVRRLQLDFSDLYERELAYDSISGLLDFSDGIVTTTDNFLIRGPSSTINVNGQLDLVNETIKADLLVNLPLGQNVSMVAGILGAWPIAIGTYVASIIFRDQLDNFTTVLYRLDGPWDNPQAGFESDNQAVEQAMEEVGVLEAETEVDAEQ